MILPGNCRGAGLLDMKGSGGHVSCLLLNDPLSPLAPVFPGAGLGCGWVSNISLVIQPCATGEEVFPLLSFSWVTPLCSLGLGGDKRTEHEEKNPVTF